MTKLHHTHATFLRLRNLDIAPDGDQFITLNGPVEWMGDGKTIVALIKAYEADTGKKVRGTGSKDKSGVMVRHYHETYTANGGGNADVLDLLLRDVLLVAEGEDGEPKLDLTKLKALAKRHDVWNDRYMALNPGMARMNVSNRLRALIRSEGEVNVAGVVISASELKAPKRAPKPAKVAKVATRKAKAAKVEQVAA